MGRRRSTIGRLMIVVAAAGAVVAAVLRPSHAWSIALPALFLTLLLTALLGVVLRRGPRRAFWLGFALFGWAFLAASLVFKDDGPGTLAPAHLVDAPLIKMLEIVAVLGTRDRQQSAELAVLAEVDDDSRLVIASATLGLLFAGLGGLIGRWLGGDSATAALPAPARRRDSGPEARDA